MFEFKMIRSSSYSQKRVDKEMATANDSQPGCYVYIGTPVCHARILEVPRN